MNNWMLSFWLAVALAVVSETRADGPSSRVYENRLTPLVDPKPLLADYPEFVEPVREIARFEAPKLVDDADADLSVRAWRFSYNARGIIEMPNSLRRPIPQSSWFTPGGLTMARGGRLLSRTGSATSAPQSRTGSPLVTREVVNPFLKSLRGKVSFVMFSIPGPGEASRKKAYRTFRHIPTALERTEGMNEIKAKLAALSYKGEPLPALLTLSSTTPVVDYFRQFPGLDPGPRYNGPGFWDVPIPVTSDVDTAPDDVVIFDKEGYPALRDFLKSNRIRHVLLTGYATDMCYCKTTAGYENLSKDFNVFLVGDASLATFPGNATPRFATNASLSLAALNQLITQISWVQYKKPSNL